MGGGSGFERGVGFGSNGGAIRFEDVVGDGKVVEDALEDEVAPDEFDGGRSVEGAFVRGRDVEEGLDLFRDGFSFEALGNGGEDAGGVEDDLECACGRGDVHEPGF